MDTGKLHVFGYGVCLDLSVLGNGIHLYFLGVLHEFSNNYRVLLAYVRRQLQETPQLVGIGAHVHGCAGENIARAHQHGEADFGHEIVDIVEAGEFAPAGLVDSQAVEHRRKFVAVFGAVDARC